MLIGSAQSGEAFYGITDYDGPDRIWAIGLGGVDQWSRCTLESVNQGFSIGRDLKQWHQSFGKGPIRALVPNVAMR